MPSPSKLVAALSFASIFSVVSAIIVSQRLMSAELVNAYTKSGVKEIIKEHLSMFHKEDVQERLAAFEFYFELKKQVDQSLLFKIDHNISEPAKKDKLDQLDQESPAKALAIVLQTETRSINAIRYLIKNLEFQTKGANTYPAGRGRDHNYQYYVCVPVLAAYRGALTEPMVEYLSSVPEEAITDKQIEILGYLLHRHYGSGQAAVRIITVLAEEATKLPHAPNVVRLIDHLGSTYKP